MNFSFFKSVLLVAALGSVMAWPRAARAAGGIHDDAQFFGPDAVRQGEQIIQHIRDAHQRDVFVQTYPQIPDDLRGDYQAQGKDKFFQTWADRVGKEHSVNGIVILISKDPAHLAVVPGNETRKRAFTDADCTEFASQLLSGFKAKKYDQALLDGLRFAQDRMDRNLRAASNSNRAAGAPGAPYGGSTHSGGTGLFGWICLAIGILIVVMLVMGIANRNRGYGGTPGYGPPMAGGYPPGGYPPNYGGGGGGGFGRGLLGGLLGGALGSWGYDQLAHRRDPNGGYTPNPAPPPDSGGGPDTSYSGGAGGDFGGGGDTGSSGGDFGGGGGGGDLGGGGGGDFGGGGGGGGDSGGSGGDF